MMDYDACVRCICRRAKCSTDEAWEGLNTAFLSLDRTLPEPAQCWWLIRIGSYIVLDSVRSQYLNTGVKRLVSSECLEFMGKPSEDDQWDFLNAFPKGLTREFSRRLGEGKGKLTYESVRHWLRTRKQINDRTTARRILNEVRIYSKRL